MPFHVTDGRLATVVYADTDTIMALPGSRWQTVLRTEGPEEDVVYFHVNNRTDAAHPDAITIEVNSDDAALNVVIQVTTDELLELAQMFLSAHTRLR